MKDQSAERVAVATEKTEESADRRTVLAANRTVFAAERTYAAWVRTGLAALASGVGAKAVLGHVMNEQLVLAAGSVLVLFSAFCFGAAVWRELIPGPPPPQPDVRSLPPVLLLALNGFLVLVALAALAGILFARTPGQ
jgi:putative membrane protein